MDSRTTTDAAAGEKEAAGDREEREVAGELGGFALARSEVDRATARRDDPDWIATAWADDRNRVLVLDEGQALVRFSGDGSAELVLVPPAQAPGGSGCAGRASWPAPPRG